MTLVKRKDNQEKENDAFLLHIKYTFFLKNNVNIN